MVLKSVLTFFYTAIDVWSWCKKCDIMEENRNGGEEGGPVSGISLGYMLYMTHFEL